MSLRLYKSFATFSRCCICSSFHHARRIFLLRVSILSKNFCRAIEVLDTDRERVSWVLHLAVTTANRLVPDAVAVDD